LQQTLHTLPERAVFAADASDIGIALFAGRKLAGLSENLIDAMHGFVHGNLRLLAL
jgi:hypothetical protein